MERADETKVRQDGWLKPIDKGAKFPYGLLRLVFQTVGDTQRLSRIGIDQLDQFRETDGQDNQSLLGAVMQVLADPATLPRLSSQSPRFGWQLVVWREAAPTAPQGRAFCRIRSLRRPAGNASAPSSVLRLTCKNTRINCFSLTP